MWNSVLESISSINKAVNGVVWGWPAIIMILGTGLLLAVRTGFLQVRKFKDSISTTIVPTIKGIGTKKEKKTTKASVSQFEAFAAAISGTVGTGNIIGVTCAIMTGGPGAVFWMWISAFFGMLTNYAENVLGLYYRKRNQDGSFSGGAFYYISNGIKQKWLGYLAAIFCLLAAIGMSGVQANKITGTLASALNIDTTWFKLTIGIIVAIATCIVILGGIKRIGKIASGIVPFMSVLFIILSIIIIAINGKAIPETFRLIFSSAFSCKAVAGGVGGFAFAQIIQKGLARGVFSNEAGLGSSVIAHSASETKEPVIQGLWGIFEVFFDTFIICTITALVVLTTTINNGIYASGTLFNGSKTDSQMALEAFSGNLGVFGTVCFSIILPMFAYTTILAWAYYGEKACEFCFQKLPSKGRKIAEIAYKIIFLLLIALSAIIASDLIWELDDTFNGLMAFPNLIALIFLSGKVKTISKNYYDRKKGIDVKPMLSAYTDLNESLIREAAEAEKESEKR